MRSHHLATVSAEEKKGSLQDMANQRGVACRAQGWKVHLCAAQLLQLVGSAADGFISTISLQWLNKIFIVLYMKYDTNSLLWSQLMLCIGDSLMNSFIV